MAAKKSKKPKPAETYYVVSAKSVAVKDARGDEVSPGGQTLWLAEGLGGAGLSTERYFARRFAILPDLAEAMRYDGSPVHLRFDPKSLRAYCVTVTHDEGKPEKLSD